MSIQSHNSRDGKTDDRRMRESGIELLKIAAIFLIVINHVVQTLCSENDYVPYQDYVLNLDTATTNAQYFVLMLFRHFGALGNTIFFVSSAWFLLHSTRFKKKKWLFLLLDVWVLSVVILTVFYCMTGGKIAGTVVIKSVFPTLFANNWYLTCYLLFYPIHPLLNRLIMQMSKRSLFRISAVMFTLYCGVNFIRDDLFFPSTIILWITLYFVMAYIQLYCTDFCQNMKKNGLLLLLGLAGYVGLMAMTDFLGLRSSLFRDRMLYGVTNCNPFLILMAIAMLNIARRAHFKSAFVNYIASLSLLIYLIHENIILRLYFRPQLLQYIYTTFGYDNILLWVLVAALFVFVFGLLCSLLYDKTLRILVQKMSGLLYPVIRKALLRIENAVLWLQ